MIFLAFFNFFAVFDYFSKCRTLSIVVFKPFFWIGLYPTLSLIRNHNAYWWNHKKYLGSNVLLLYRVMFYTLKGKKNIVFDFKIIDIVFTRQFNNSTNKYMLLRCKYMQKRASICASILDIFIVGRMDYVFRWNFFSYLRFLNSSAAAIRCWIIGIVYRFDF